MIVVRLSCSRTSELLASRSPSNAPILADMKKTPRNLGRRRGRQHSECAAVHPYLPLLVPIHQTRSHGADICRGTDHEQNDQQQ